jgi:hypothetical protein
MAPPLSLGSEKLSVYEEKLRTFVPDHPFLSGKKFANIVFADYIRAFVSTSPFPSVHGASREELLSVCQAPGPFLAQFVYALIVSPNASLQDEISRQEKAVISDELVDDLIKSNAAASYGAASEGFIYTSIELQNRTRQATLVLTGPTNDNALEIELRSGSLYFEIDNPSGLLVLSSPLSHGTILGPDLLISPSAAATIELGPGLFISAKEIEFSGKKLFASGTGSEAGVFIAAENIRHDSNFEIIAMNSDHLGVHLRNSWYPWNQFLVKLSLSFESYVSQELWDFKFAIRRILVSFRQSASNDPSIHADRMTNVIVGINPMFQAVLDGLMELGVVAGDKKSSYVLKLAILGTYEVDYTSLRGPHFVEKIKNLSTALTKTEPVARLLQRQRNV